MEQERIPISLNESSPSTFTAEDLRKQLHQIGLNCEQTSVENLQRHLDDMLNNLPDGSIQGFGMYKSAEPSGEIEMDAASLEPIDSIKNNWEPSDNVPYKTNLSIIGVAQHFDYLATHYHGFPGKKAEKSIQEKEATLNAFQQIFVQITESISETLLGNLDRKQMEAVLKTIIQSVDPGSGDYDSGPQHHLVFLIDDYDPDSQSCKQIGVLGLQFRIVIQNYNDTSEEYKNYFADISVRTSFYSNIDELYAEVKFIKEHFK